MDQNAILCSRILNAYSCVHNDCVPRAERRVRLYRGKCGSPRFFGALDLFVRMEQTRQSRTMCLCAFAFGEASFISICEFPIFMLVQSQSECENDECIVSAEVSHRRGMRASEENETGGSFRATHNVVSHSQKLCTSMLKCPFTRFISDNFKANKNVILRLETQKSPVTTRNQSFFSTSTNFRLFRSKFQKTTKKSCFRFFFSLRFELHEV